MGRIVMETINKFIGGLWKYLVAGLLAVAGLFALLWKKEQSQRIEAENENTLNKRELGHAEIEKRVNDTPLGDLVREHNEEIKRRGSSDK